MGFLGGLLSVVASFIDKATSLIPGFNVENNHLVESVNFINSLLIKVDKFFPVSEVGEVLSLMISIYLCLMAFYFIQRAINLLRGSG